MLSIFPNHQYYNNPLYTNNRQNAIRTYIHDQITKSSLSYSYHLHILSKISLCTVLSVPSDFNRYSYFLSLYYYSVWHIVYQHSLLVLHPFKFILLLLQIQFILSRYRGIFNGVDFSLFCVNLFLH